MNIVVSLCRLLLQGSIMVTGGLGMIGSLFGLWLARQLVPHVELLSRSGRYAPGRPNAIQLANRDGLAAAVCIVQCDSSLMEEASTCFAAHKGRKRQGVIQCGGVLADGTIPSQTPSKVRISFAPKTSCAKLCQMPTILHPTIFNLACSSVAALLGSPGQANYSAANACLDGMALAWQAQVLLMLICVRMSMFKNIDSTLHYPHVGFGLYKHSMGCLG